MSDSFVWQGRNDDEEIGDSRRFHHQVGYEANSQINQEDKPSDLGIAGFACDLGVKANLGRVGAKTAPNAIRAQLANLAWHGGDKRICDFGNVDTFDSLADAQSQMSEKILTALTQTKVRVLVLGGGHETAFTSLNALHKHYFQGQSRTKEKLGIINFDAHFDLRKPSSRGISSGTPFYQAKQLFNDDFHYCCLGVAAESNTKALFERAQSYGVRYLLDTQINGQSMHQAQSFIEQFCADKTLLYICIDMDVLPHYQAPGVSAPASRGVALNVLEEMLSLIQEYAAKNSILIPLVEVSELNPTYDTQGVTAKTAAILSNRLLVGDSSITVGL